MALPLAFGIFFVIWWITLFAVMPFGIKTQQEEQSIVPGTAESAPANPRLLKTALITTAISCVLFAIAHWAYVSPDITLDSVPFLPRF